MFTTFFIREIKTGLKQPLIYVFFLVFAIMTAAAVVSDKVTIGGATGNVFRNAPDIVTTYTTILGIFGVLIAFAFYNNAALRDFRYQFNEIMFTTPVSKFGYYAGRFLGAWILSSLTMTGVFFGFIAGSFIGPAFDLLEADQLGPIPWRAFAANFLIFVLPNMFLAGAIIFGLASRFKNTMISFMGALVIFMGYLIGLNFISDIENEQLAGMLDIFGISTYSVESKYYTTIEKNTLIPAFKGLLMKNRLLWIGVGALVSILFYSIFSFKKKSGRKKRSAEFAGNDNVKKTLFDRPTSFQPVSAWTEFKSFFSLNVKSISKSMLFKILFLFSAILVISSIWGGFEYYGLKSYPVTYKMVGDISGQSALFLLIIMVFYSGELVWRDRDVHIHEVIGASPYRTLMSLLAKSLSLVVVIFLLYTGMVVIGVGYQLLHGFTDIDLPLYFIDFLLDSAPLYVTWSLLLIFIQVLVNNKYLGYFISIILMVLSDILLMILDVNSNLVDIGSGPSLMYSEMNGFGPGKIGASWFGLYWLLFGILAIIKAAAFWQRGTERGFVKRMKNAITNLNRNYRTLFITVAVLWVAIGGWIYYNTQVLNSYTTSKKQEKIQAAYEKEYKQYELLPKLSVEDVKYTIDIYPEGRDVYVNSDLIMKNKTDQPIDYIHLIVGGEKDDWYHQVDIPNSKQTSYDEESGYVIYEIPELLPGQTMSMNVKATFETNGFENSAGNRSVVQNGSFFNNSAILPSFGYSAGYELSGKFKRRKYGLEPKKRTPDLEENCTKTCHRNYLSDGASDWINVETVISTSADQIAIAPGSLIKQWEDKGRNYYHYKVDHPSQNFYSFISADYEVARKKWKGVDIEVYYDAAHGYNIDMMLDAVERSLAYYTENFGPYYHKQARIIEFPRYATFAQAFPGTMPYSEAFGFVIDLEDENKNNVIDAVIAHEMAHQWWGHQVVSSFMQGGTMLVESFAEYSSLMVMKHQLNDDIKMKEFLKYDYNRYLGGRSGETEKEVPLNKVENQSYIHYGKGSVILYALQDYIGEDSVNLAMKSFLEEYKYAEPPYPNTHDFLRHLRPRVPDSLQYLIKDWIEEITLYDFRLKDAKLTETTDGKYVVELDLYADKLRADSVGNETSMGIRDWVDIGFYSDEEEKELFYHERVFLKDKEDKIVFSLDEKPVFAGIDPRRMLIERVVSDNVKRVE